MTSFEGRAFVYGDNVDTDVIIPARHLTTTDPKELARNCMQDLDPEFASTVRPGDLIVGGRNFGSGSSREHAPIAIEANGVACVVAESFARIFFRNAVNVGLPIVECPDVTEDAESGDRFRVDLDSGVVENVTRGRKFQGTPLPPFMRDILDAGGLMPWVARSLRQGDAGAVRVGVAANEPPQSDWRLD
ncbi:MAG: 3-isopropylmalate dehydratase small subunit [Actinomycetota bacterium]